MCVQICTNSAIQAVQYSIIQYFTKSSSDQYIVLCRKVQVKMLQLLILIKLILSIVVHSQINLSLQLHLDATKGLLLKCTFKAGSVDLCERSSTVTRIPQCSCNFSKEHLSSDGQCFHSILQNCVGHFIFYRLGKEN